MKNGVIHIRINDKTHKEIEKAAKAEHRSFSAQCATVLEDWVEDRKPKPSSMQPNA